CRPRGPAAPRGVKRPLFFRDEAGGRRAALYFIFVTVLLDMLALGMLVGPAIFAIAFAAFIAPERAVKVPGAPWYAAALLLLVATAVAWADVPRTAATAGARSKVPEAQVS